MSRRLAVLFAACAWSAGAVAHAGEVGAGSDPALRRAIVWASIYGGPGDDFLITLAPMPDGGVISHGQWSIEGKPGFDKGVSTLVRFSADGRALWQWQADGPRNPLITQVVPTRAGGVIVGGQIRDATDGRAWVGSFLANGALAWSAVIDDGAASRIDDLKPLAAAGVAALVGVSDAATGSGVPDPDRFSVRMFRDTGEAAGRVEVTAELDGLSGWRAWFAGNDFILTARRRNDGGQWRDGLFVRKIATNSDRSWERAFPHEESYGYTAMKALDDGGALLLGLEFVAEHGGRADVRLLRLSPSGEDRWVKTLGGLSDDVGRSLHEMANGMLMVGALSVTEEGSSAAAMCLPDSRRGAPGCPKLREQAAVMCLTPDGGDLWIKRFAGRRFVETVAPLVDRTVVMGGPVSAPGGDLDIWTGRFDERTMPLCG